MAPSLQITLPRGVVLRDPLLLASGCCAYGEAYSEIIHPTLMGGVITKAVSVEMRLGNSLPRLRETPAGLLNCIGLQNPGVDRFNDEVVPRLTMQGISFLVNVVGKRVEDFAEVTRRVELAWQDLLASQRRPARRASALHGEGGATRVDVLDATASPMHLIGDDGLPYGLLGYEIDLSCPNVDKGTSFATDCDLMRETIQACREQTGRLLVAKLSPNVTDITVYARIALEAGADAVTISNTYNGISIDIRSRASHVARPSAGLSGAAIRPAVLYHVWRCKREFPELPILGSGGITDVDSAIQFLLAGATALQLGTGMFTNPGLAREILVGLPAYLEQQDEDSVMNIIGTYKA